MKKMLTIVLLMSFGGCATLVPETKFIYPTPPATLMTPAQPLKPMVPGVDGNVDPKTALGVIIENNNVAKLNAEQLNALENWINETAKNIKKNATNQ